MPARTASDWSIVRIYPRLLRPIGPCILWLRIDIRLTRSPRRPPRGTRPPASDWSIVRIYPRVLHPIGPL
eukprot:1179056-Prorocentrum_minimum.AAC.2